MCYHTFVIKKIFKGKVVQGRTCTQTVSTSIVNPVRARCSPMRWKPWPSNRVGALPGALSIHTGATALREAHKVSDRKRHSVNHNLTEMCSH